MKIDNQQYWLLVARFWLLVASYWLLHLMSLDQRKAYITQKPEERAKIQAENSVGIKNAQSLTIALRIFHSVAAIVQCVCILTSKTAIS